MERDPLLDELRCLPAIEPLPELDVRIREAAHVVLSERPPSLHERLFYRALIPALLSGVTATYLVWAVQAASALY
jgi:hypothetical protein